MFALPAFTTHFIPFKVPDPAASCGRFRRLRLAGGVHLALVNGHLTTSSYLFSAAEQRLGLRRALHVQPCLLLKPLLR
jgi:hypothetical protein